MVSLMANNYYKPKVWNVLCDSCGFKFKSDQIRKRWDGLMVDDACWETRNPQDFLRSIIETSNRLPYTRPDTTGIDVGPQYTTLYITDDYFVDSPPIPPGTYFEQL